VRWPYHFFFPEQLEAVGAHPERMVVAYSLFVAGNVMLWPTVIMPAQMIPARCPWRGLAGGTLAMFGLFARTFHAGTDHLAFQLVPAFGVKQATNVVAGSYDAFHIFHWVSFAILFGWLVLAVGAWRSGVLPFWRAIALGFMTGLMIGFLKGSTEMSVVATGGLSVGLCPLGWDVLKGKVRAQGL
jgi:hypothetical protein